MRAHIFFRSVGLIFTIITVVHGLRLIYGWDIAIGALIMPMWLSWVAILLAASLAYSGFRLAKRRS